MFWHWDMLLTGFHWKYFNWRQLEFYGQLNMLKAGIVFADQITTVSPTYAQEIQAAPGGCGLEGVLQERASDLTGIVNGIDTELWNPKADEFIPCHYGIDNVQDGKYAARVALAARLGHTAPDERPLLAFVGRLAEQKGVSLVIDLLHRMAGSGLARFVVLGAGDPQFQESLKIVSSQYPEAIDVVIGFDEVLAHLIQAAADILLMPSQYEPCGLAQLYAFRYGTIPIVRATGGLVDTVVNVSDQTCADGTASGFVFDAFEPAALEAAVRRAIDAHGNTKLWQDLIRGVMQQDWSWDVSARKYQEVFSQARANAPVDVVDVR
jgi:starch synthase